VSISYSEISSYSATGITISGVWKFVNSEFKLRSWFASKLVPHQGRIGSSMQKPSILVTKIFLTAFLRFFSSLYASVLKGSIANIMKMIFAGTLCSEAGVSISTKGISICVKIKSAKPANTANIKGPYRYKASPENTLTTKKAPVSFMLNTKPVNNPVRISHLFSLLFIQ